jgi:hypothetical protein
MLRMRNSELSYSPFFFSCRKAERLRLKSASAVRLNAQSCTRSDDDFSLDHTIPRTTKLNASTAWLTG